ncbi:MAG TPA: L,D-transpeptidase [Solirubrobacteraceae bacterium]|nr:L,D-transpeptidase [Solirubrobacteraceae bacterium]
MIDPKRPLVLAGAALALGLAAPAAAAAEGSGGAPAPEAASPGTTSPEPVGAPAPATAPGSQPAPASTPPGAGAPAPAPPGAAAPVAQRLSNETTFTTWAHPAQPQWIHARPRASSRRLARVHLETEEGFPEVYLLLASRTGLGAQTWIELRIPGRPNGRVGWVRRSALGAFHVTHWAIVINLGKRRLTASYDARVRLVAPVGVGKPSTPTPPGRFWIRERFRIANRSNPYWPYAFGTSDYSTLSEWPGGGVVGIHGPYGEPGKIPGDPSHGCIRMLDRGVAWLGAHITLGTPVHIVE